MVDLTEPNLTRYHADIQPEETSLGAMTLFTVADQRASSGNEKYHFLRIVLCRMRDTPSVFRVVGVVSN